MSGAATDPGAEASVLPWHWREYLIEGALLGLFMVSACGFATLLEHPASPVRQALPDPMLRRTLMGLAMGLTAVGLIYSPWGQRSGAHMNPGVTLTFLRLGKVAPRDALGYGAAHFVGAVAGVELAALALRGALADPAVGYVVTRPGRPGLMTAWVLELVISFGLMAVVLLASNNGRLTRFTGLFAALLLAGYITFEAPYSGTSLNAARSFGSALVGSSFGGLWVYLTAPPLGMVLAGELYRRLRGRCRVYCAKLHHVNDQPCIFRCRFDELEVPHRRTF